MTLSSVLRLFCNGLSAAIAAPAVTMDPNPATDEVKVTYTTGSKKKAEVWVLDLSGVCIYTKDLGVTRLEM